MPDTASQTDIVAAQDAAAPILAERPHRYAVMLAGTIKLQASRRDGMPIRVRDISASGLMGECGYPTRIGDLVEVEIPRFGRITGRVRWGAMGRVGIQFDEAIDPAIAFSPPRRSGLVSAH